MYNTHQVEGDRVESQVDAKVKPDALRAKRKDVDVRRLNINPTHHTEGTLPGKSLR